jgi:hypothetical protein
MVKKRSPTIWNVHNRRLRNWPIGTGKLKSLVVRINREQPVGELKMPVLSNAKHELFSQQLALGKTASEAYELAGYKPSRSNASVLRAKQNISDRLAEILQESEKTVLNQIEYTRERLLAKLDHAYDVAEKRSNGSAMSAAIVAQARICGLIIDRREVGEVGAFDHLTDEELVAEAAKKARELGLAGPELVEDNKSV